MEREGFIFYRSFAESLKEVDAETKAAVLDMLCSYALDGIELDASGIPAALFMLMKPYVDRGLHMLDGQNGRNSSEYAQWRKKVFERDGYTCQMCGVKGGVLNAHHIKKYSEFPNLRYDLDNGVTLCKGCHRKVHKK